MHGQSTACQSLTDSECATVQQRWAPQECVGGITGRTLRVLKLHDLWQQLTRNTAITKTQRISGRRAFAAGKHLILETTNFRRELSVLQKLESHRSSWSVWRDQEVREAGEAGGHVLWDNSFCTRQAIFPHGNGDIAAVRTEEGSWKKPDSDRFSEV